MKDMIETFLVVFAVGGLISSAAWYYSKAFGAALAVVIWRRMTLESQ